jgi:DMSO reductase iron-sulfur subunit
MGIQKAFYYNQNYCVGCTACQMACNVAKTLDLGVTWREVEEYEIKRNGKLVATNLSHACNHCKSPACLKSCPVGAYTKREKDGLVVQDHSKCIGCGNCVKACPYKAAKMNTKTKKAEKCDGCFDLLDHGEEAACVRGCPVQVLKMGNLDELEAKGAVREVFGFTAFKTNPSTRFVPLKKG